MNPSSSDATVVHGESATVTLIVPTGLAEMRLDSALTNCLKTHVDLPAHLTITRSKVALWIEAGRVVINGLVVNRPGMRTLAGAQVVISLPPLENHILEADASVPIALIYEDDALLVLNKPAGLVVHPGAGNRHGTLVQGVLSRIERWPGSSLRPGIVHRLDKDTTGLLVIAKSEAAYHHLVAQFVPPRQIRRGYLALVAQLPQTAGQEIALAIARNRADRKKMTIDPKGGKEARTHWQVREELRSGYLLELTLETGRTHQIRVHLRAVGAPIIGDQVYGPPIGQLPAPLRPAVKRFARQALHAESLSFIHPLTAERLQFSVPPANDMLELIECFRLGKPIAKS